MRYKSRSPLPVHSRSRSPVRAQSHNRKRSKTKSASRSPESPVISRPRKRLLGKTPPLPSRNQSSSPLRYGHDQTKSKGREVLDAKGVHDRSRSPMAYSSRKVARPYTPPSPQQKRKGSYDKNNSTSPVRKQNSPPPKAYALSSNRRQSPRWSRSRSKSEDGSYSSRSPVHRMDTRSSSSTSPPRYGRSPAARNSSPPASTKREPVSPRSVSKRNHSPEQRYRHDCTAKYSRSPEVRKRDRSPIYRRDNSPAVHRRSPSDHSRSPRRRASPESPPWRTMHSSPSTQTTEPWSQASRRYEQNRKQSPVSRSVVRNGRSPSDHGHTTRSDRERRSVSGRRGEYSPVSRDRRSPRH